MRGMFEVDLVLDMDPHIVKGYACTLRGPPPSVLTRGGMVRNALPDIGLKLEARRVAVEVLVIDRVEKEPTGN